MEKVLLFEKQSLDFKGIIEDLNTRMETDYDGNKTVKEINVLVWLVKFGNQYIWIYFSETGWYSSGSGWVCFDPVWVRTPGQNYQSIYFGNRASIKVLYLN